MNATRNRTRLLAGLLVLGAAGTVSAAPTESPAVVYCKAQLVPSGTSGNEILAVELPPTPGYTDPDGDPVTIWNVGQVAEGGVADTWHDGGPGYFTARNAGNVGAYVYVMAISRDEMPDPNGGWDRESMFPWLFSSELGYWWFPAPKPSPRDEDLGNGDYTSFADFHLALTTDATAVAPTWRPLAQVSYAADFGSVLYNRRQCSAYLAWMPPGEYQPFDLKFWAPQDAPTTDPLGFVFRVEASTFPRWEHDR